MECKIDLIRFVKCYAFPLIHLLHIKKKLIFDQYTWKMCFLSALIANGLGTNEL